MDSFKAMVFQKCASRTTNDCLMMNVWRSRLYSDMHRDRCGCSNDWQDEMVKQFIGLSNPDPLVRA